VITTARLAVDFTAEQANDLDLGRGVADLMAPWLKQYTAGTGAGQADLLWTDNRTLAASATESLDLAGGSLVDPFGNTVTFARVKVLLALADAGNTNDVLLGGAAANAWATWAGDVTDIARVKPGGVFLAAAPGATGYPVTAGTGDLLKVANSAGGTPVTYRIVLLGASA
jgi:hypothetical protein